MSAITSTFNRNADGWTMVGDVAQFTWQSTGGDKGGYIFWEDAAAGSDSYWVAPAKFTGDLSGYYGGKLSYAAYASADNYQTGDVLLTGANGATLVADVTDPGTDWTKASVTLSPRGGWHVDTLEGALATKAQIAAVLADVTSLQIRAEHVNGGETGGLDTVKLASKAAHADVLSNHAPHHVDAHHGVDLSHIVLV